MHKVAILTQALGHNYGGIIQNYALQRILNDCGCDCYTIYRTANNPHSKLKIFASECKVIVKRHVLKRKVLSIFDYAKVNANTTNFIKKNIKLSPKLRTTEALKKYFSLNIFDIVIVGSDQVWRPKYSPDIFNFFLDFLEDTKKIRKLSYAASFGTKEWEFSVSETEKCTKLIQLFDAVSVRENSGIKLCSDFLNRNDVVNVLDPTLLLTAEDYNELISESKNAIGLFTYVLDMDRQKSEFISSCANKIGLTIHTNQAKESIQNLSVENLVDCLIPPIEGWLQGFKDAEFVITDSFHGTVFSIINEKPFFALVNKDRGASRFESLLTQLGLEDRLINDIDTFDFSQLKSKIDYAYVNQKLNVLREESFKFIKQYL